MFLLQMLVRREYVVGLTMRVWRCIYCVDKLHVAYIVEVDLILKNHNETFAVQPNCENGCGECKFAYRISSLQTHAIVSLANVFQILLS